MHRELHVAEFDNGHMSSTDCWCEPVNISRVRGPDGIPVVVVEHNDTTADHHLSVLYQRNRRLTMPYVGQYVADPLNHSDDAPWISRILNECYRGPLPPQYDPNERKL